MVLGLTKECVVSIDRSKIKQSGVNFLYKDYTCTLKEKGEILG